MSQSLLEIKAFTARFSIDELGGLSRRPVQFSWSTDMILSADQLKASTKANRFP